ncbi:hypothetical protein J4475_00755 [Candidatus Woesearchaeota archaeon]|nr:hypothetical protein [Candidatus Woesearchaeota archaeon]
MGMKGYYFTLDALLASAILLGSIVLFSNLYVSNPAKASQTDFLSTDLARSLSTLSVGEADNGYVKELIANGTITNLGNSVFEQAAEFWVEGRTDLAGKLLDNITSGMVPKNVGFGFYIDGDPVLLHNNSPGTRQISSKVIVSGIQRNTTPEGFNARTFATKIRKNTTDVFPLNTEGGAFDNGKKLYITKWVFLNFTGITSSKLTVAVHGDTSNDDRYEINNVAVDIGSCGSCDGWLYENTTSTWKGFDTKTLNVPSYNFVPGWNKIFLRLHSQGGHTHLHPGGRLELTYQAEGKFTPANPVRKRIYLDNIESEGSGQSINSGIWAIVPAELPEGTELYSDPPADQAGSSYVEYWYRIVDSSKLKFGKIDVSIVYNFTGLLDNQISSSWDFSNAEVIEAFAHIAELDSRNVSVSINSNNVFVSPSANAVPSYVYLDSNKVVPGINTIALTESCTDCFILNESRLQYLVLVPSQVGYGDTFPTKQQAIDDAIQRLHDVLGQSVEALQLDTSVVALSKVPSLWGPTIIEARVWK